MSRARFYPLAFLLVFSTLKSQAQARTTASPATPQKELVVRVTLPTVVGVLGEYAGILRSKEKGKLKSLTGPDRPRSTSNPVLILSIPLPKLLADRKENPAP